MKKCPYCNDDLQAVSVDIEGLDILGCDYCEYVDSTYETDCDMQYYIP